MYVEVTDTYRQLFQSAGLGFMMDGNGQGKIVKTMMSDDGLIPQYRIEWANGRETTIAQSHMKESTRKAFFQAKLSC